MKVFISWSGQKSRDVAELLGDWLPSVLHAAKPFVSARDIRAGTRWQSEIATELDDTDFGLICVTRENQAAEWLNFEAGALAKSVDFSRVVPIAIDIAPAEIPAPLGQFQAIRLNQEDFGDLLVSMNESSSAPISEQNVHRALGKWWPDLKLDLGMVEERDYQSSSVAEHPPRSDRELLEEVLDSIRTVNRSEYFGLRGVNPERASRINSIIRNQLNSEGIETWGIVNASATRRVIQLEEKPSVELTEFAESISMLMDLEIEFELKTDFD
jgi:hypothetical protein